MTCPCPTHSTRRFALGSTYGLVKVTNQGTHWYFTRCKAMQYDVLEYHFYPASLVVNIGDVFLSRLMRWVMILWWFAPKKTLTAEILIWRVVCSLSGVPDFFDRNKMFSGGDLSHYQVPHCIRVFFYFVWFVFIHHNFQFYFELCTYCNILDIYLS